MFKKNESREKEIREYVFTNWSEERKRGIVKYSLSFSLLSWTIPTFTIYALIMFLGSKFFPASGLSFSLGQSLFSLLTFFSVGYIYGNYNYKRFEKIYLEKFPYDGKIKENKDSKSKIKPPK